MKIRILDVQDIYNEVADVFVDVIKSKTNPILGLATGSTPIGVYDELIKRNKEGKVSFKNVTSFNLDEYVGLDGNHDQSYRYFMNTHLFNHVDIDKNKTFVPLGIGDIKDNAKKYDLMIDAAGGIDLQILGIGSDGHIAFNEPGTPFNSLTHVAELAQSTIEDNSRFFNSIEEVPTKAVTMGLASIMKAKKIVLIATGENKADAIQGLLQGLVTEQLPCSVLRHHPDVTIYVDKAAYSKVKM
jgi:glucosamine-6-phosphate deaminase